MNAKRILFIVLCVLLAAVLVLTGIALSKFKGFLGLDNTPAPTEPTTPSEAPTDPQSTEHVHDYALTETIKATCTGYGWNVYTCKTCDHLYMPTSERTDPLGHGYDNGKVTEADCTNGGFTEYTCTRCGLTNIPAESQKAPLGHNWDHGRVFVATCESGGYTEFTCMRCNLVEKRDPTDPLGHQFDNVIESPATCTEDAYTLELCSRPGCGGQNKIVEENTATGHSPGQWHFQGPNAFYLHCSTCAYSLRETAGEGIAYDILLDQHQPMTDETGAAYTHHSVIIGVPDDASVKPFTYTVNDYLGDESLTLSYQIGVGFVMTFLVDGVEQSYSIDHTAPLTITIPPTGIPTIE
ncbi:MAG: hypothetical protein IJZ15_03730 [Oscillospiraceae bacterium]|nr:hypothetical protein [Oscillospiraceae bacterium]